MMQTPGWLGVFFLGPAAVILILSPIYFVV